LPSRHSNKIKRKKREEYIENDDQMSRILIELAARRGALPAEGQEEFSGQQLVSVLESLQELKNSSTPSNDGASSLKTTSPRAARNTGEFTGLRVADQGKRADPV